MNVTLPNGAVIQGVPEGTPKEEIARKAIAAGLAQESDFVDVMPSQPAQQQPEQEPSLFQRAADMFTGESRMTPEMESLSEIGNAPELNKMSWSAFKTSLGLLATGDDEKAKSVIKSNIPEAEFTNDSAGNTIVNLPSGQYALNKPGISPQDIAKGVFDIAAFTPAGRAASIPAAAAKAGATELGLQEATRQVGGGDIDIGDVALSAALGGGGKAAEEVIGAGYRALRGTPESEAAKTITEGASRGIPVTTSDVAPPTTLPGRFAQQVGESVPIVGTGGMREAQQEARQSAAESFVSRYAPDYDEIKRSITGKAAKVKKAAIDSRQRAVQQVADIKTPASNTVKAIDDEIERLSRLPGGAERQVVDQSSIDTLNRYKADIQAGGDFKTIDDLRTTFRDDLSPDFGKPGTRQEGAIKRIYGAMTKDMDDVIKNNLTPTQFRQWKRGNAVYGQEMQKLKDSRIKNILQGGEELSPEQINRTIMSKDSVVRKKLYNSLDNTGRQNARAAMISEISGKASPGGELSVNRFLNELDRNKAQIDTFFKGREKAELEGLKKALNATRRAQEASVLTRTGMTTTPVIAGGAAMYDLGATLASGAAAGALSRAYESKMFRDALVRLNGTKKGSTAFESALADVAEYITLSAQAGRRSETTQEDQVRQRETPQ